MAGLGHVEPGGDPVTERLSDDLRLTKVSVGSMDNNAYLLAPTDGGTVLIDAADEPGRLLALLGDRPLAAVVTTHRHRDHIQALAAVADATGATLYCGTPDQSAIADSTGVAGLRGLWDGDQIEVGTEHLRVVGLVGHTPGSITLVYTAPGGQTHLFTGDSLFPGGPGKTGSPNDFDSLMNDLETKIFDRYPDETRVHPGHGDDTTLGRERPQLPQWRARGW